MAGILSTGVPTLPLIIGSEMIALDTGLPGGAVPQMATISLDKLAAAMNYLGNNLSTTTVAGTRYYSSVAVGAGSTITGISALIGATGGTDKFIYELHDSTGNSRRHHGACRRHCRHGWHLPGHSVHGACRSPELSSRTPTSSSCSPTAPRRRLRPTIPRPRRASLARQPARSAPRPPSRLRPPTRPASALWPSCTKSRSAG
jgi:hypothetical protein